TVFTAPAMIALLLLLTQTAGDAPGSALLLPGLLALLIPLTGLGSGACQEAFRQRAEGQTPTVGSCLMAALRHRIDHIAARAVILALMIPAFFVMVMPQLALWV